VERGKAYFSKHMAQAVSWLPLAASSEHRSSELVDSPVHLATNAQARPPSSSSSPSSLEFRRWDVNNHQIYNPPSSSAASSPTREQRMSLDYGSHHPPLYTQTSDLDHPTSVVSLADTENISSPTSPHPLSGSITSNFDHSDSIDHNYDLFANSPQATTFASARYRNNASSSSSLSHSGYPLSPETMYPPHAPFNDSYNSSSTGQQTYDILQTMPSSYSSGKVSPLTPSDPHPYTPVSAKEYAQQQPGYSDLLPDRRLSNTYSTDYHDDYAVNGNSAISPHSFSTRFQHDPIRYSDASPSSHIHPSGVPPQATTQAYRADSAMQGYGSSDITHYQSHIGSHHSHPHSRPHPHPHADLSLRMPPLHTSVDETLARMKLQNHSGIGSTAGDLVSFIRLVFFLYRLILERPHLISFN
jgi:recombining binding protein suppressor of hairless